MTEWKDAASPVKEWISKYDKKIQTYGVVKPDHDAVVKQRQDVKVGNCRLCLLLPSEYCFTTIVVKDGLSRLMRLVAGFYTQHGDCLTST